MSVNPQGLSTAPTHAGPRPGGRHRSVQPEQTVLSGDVIYQPAAAHDWSCYCHGGNAAETVLDPQLVSRTSSAAWVVQ